jgi:hypothetical protein
LWGAASRGAAHRTIANSNRRADPDLSPGIEHEKTIQWMACSEFVTGWFFLHFHRGSEVSSTKIGTYQKSYGAGLERGTTGKLTCHNCI